MKTLRTILILFSITILSCQPQQEANHSDIEEQTQVSPSDIEGLRQEINQLKSEIDSLKSGKFPYGTYHFPEN